MMFERINLKKPVLPNNYFMYLHIYVVRHKYNEPSPCFMYIPMYVPVYMYECIHTTGVYNVYMYTCMYVPCFMYIPM
jgi:hypothetical protein